MSKSKRLYSNVYQLSKEDYWQFLEEIQENMPDEDPNWTPDNMPQRIRIVSTNGIEVVYTYDKKEKELPHVGA